MTFEGEAATFYKKFQHLFKVAVEHVKKEFVTKKRKVEDENDDA